MGSMILEKIQPFGYCNGVNFAIKSLNQIIKNNPNKQIHLIGLVVHNTKTNNEFLKNKNVVLHTQPNHIKIVKDILKKSKNKKILLFILPTHGTDPQVIELIKKNHCQFYDFICGHIKLLISKIKKAFAKGYDVYFYGKQNHPETQCIQKTFAKKNFFVFSKKSDLKPNNHKKFVVCQTTTNCKDFIQIKKWFKNAVFEDTICNFCKLKQKNADCFKNSKNSIVVISDNKSNNGLVLFKMLKTNNKHVFLISPDQKKLVKVKKTNKIHVFTSSSVSKQQANCVLKKQFN